MSPAEARPGDKSPRDRQGATQVDKERRKYRLPGYGWSSELSGLSRRREWLGFFLVAVAVLLVIVIGGYILQAVGVW